MENARTSIQAVVLMLGGIPSTLEWRSLGCDLLLTCAHLSLWRAEALSFTLLRSYEPIRRCESVWLHACELSWFGQKPVLVECWQCCRLPSVMLVALLEVNCDSISALRGIHHELFLLGAEREESIGRFYLACLFLVELVCSGTLML